MERAALAETLERLCSLLRTDTRRRALSHGLRPVHVEALLYLARCNRYSDTPQAVTEFLGSTKGTVSQTLKVLEREELLTKRPDADDRRVVRLQLTPRGRQLAAELARSPVVDDALAAGAVPADRLAGDLRRLLAEMQRAGGYKTFGACHTCRFFGRFEGPFEGPEPRSFRCGLTGEPLTAADSELMCREHEVPTGSGADGAT